MKIRTSAELMTHLRSDLAWRLAEIRELQACVLLAPLATTGTANAAIAAVAFLRAQQDQATRLSKASVGTSSNLNSKVFKNIAEWLDIDHRPYSTRFSTLDEVLLANRNAIAHGEHLFIDIVRFQTLVDEVVEMLHWFKTDIENAVAQKAFLAAVPSCVVPSIAAAPSAGGREPPSAT